MKLRTLFLDQGETLGGAERFLLDFFQSLNASEIRQISPIVVGAKLPKYRKMLPKNIEVIEFPFPSVKGNFLVKISAMFRILTAARRLKKMVKETGATQIFSNTPRTSFVMLIAKSVFRIPTTWVVMLHDFTIPKFLLRKICAKANVIIVNSIATRQYVRECITARDQKKIKIVENGIDFQKIPKAEPPKKIQKILILGRIDPRKGQLFALEAADLLRERNPELKFFVVGATFSGDPATIKYERKIKKFAADRKLNNVYFLPEVADPFETFISADMVLILPTEPETFGRIAIEALAVGKLTIAFDQAGPREILKAFAKFCGKPESSLLAEKENPMSLAEKIGFFADHPTFAEPFTTRARAFVEKHYPLTETKKRLLNILLGK